MSQEELKHIGKPTPLVQSREIVTGNYKYVADIPAELSVKILRSPHPHALIKHIDTKKAEELDGVVAILTHKDVPSRLMPRSCARACYILEDHLRFVGDEVAAVAATSQAAAEEALELIEVEYQVLPAVYDPMEAAKEDAPKLYPEGNVYGPLFLPLVEKGVNAPTLYEFGNIEQGFKDADLLVEGTFETKPQIHSPIELHACTASWRGDELTLWNTTQCPYEVRDGVAYALDMPESKVRIISPITGGAFGSKYLERYVPIVALLSRKAGGKSTKLVFTREEEQCHVKRAADKTYVKIGVKKDGNITAILFRTYKDLGGYGNPIGGVCNFAEETPIISYKTRNARFEGWDVHTNYISTQPCRTVHLPAYLFALEQVIDMAAAKVGMDPADFRLKNMPESGETMPLEPYKAPGFQQAIIPIFPSKKIMREVMDRIDWKRWKGVGKPISVDGPKKRGIGIVYSVGWGGYNFDGFTSQAVAINKDGSVNILTGAQELGTGILTTLSMLAAESLGVTMKDINIFSSDTSINQYDYLGAKASRELTTGGHLLLMAIEDAKEKIRQIASPILEAPAEIIEVKNKKVFITELPEKALPLSQVITSSITGAAAGPSGSVSPELEPGVKARQALVMAAEVEVDTETGEVKVIKLVTGNCPGRVINSAVVKGQYTGGAVMALGMALHEEFNFDEVNEVYLSGNLEDYKLPRALDVPPIENVIIEEIFDRPSHAGLPYGAMGVGELGCWGPPAVIANAIYNATGVRMTKCPMTSERVFEALREEVIQ